MKICSRCKTEQPNDEFYQSQTRCKACTKIMNAENRRIRKARDMYQLGFPAQWLREPMSDIQGPLTYWQQMGVDILGE